MKDGISVGIIGGGAAGMMAAITASRNGAEVTILEAGERLGKKILSTGNGKCNLGNTLLSTAQYRGSCDFLGDVLERFGIEETIAFFEGLGLLIKEKNGYLYPLCEQASAVLDILRFEINARKIRVLENWPVQDIKKGKNGEWIVFSEGRRESFDRLILTCGGKAMPNTGSDGSGYVLAKKLGHKIVPVVPALTNLVCKEDFFKGIAGVRTQARVAALTEKGEELCEDLGELQLTDRGISGIPVFQISRFVSYELGHRSEVKVMIDLLPSLQETTEKIVSQRMMLRDGRTVEECLTGIFPKKVLLLMIKRAGLRPADSAEKLTKAVIEKMLYDAKHFIVTAIGTGDFKNCQVCAGGVDCHEVTQSMGSKLAEGIFFAGEILDVDGICGGYNLQWAWTSGYIAGLSASERRK
ncbi:MAG: aminoacetone oxidase family FAD-binding enzyme [Lachnospiraceae bacterium]|nr:aminoacetone oxidase family FAD-binding enzyme [Lachnospiraceae bacterium]